MDWNKIEQDIKYITQQQVQIATAIPQTYRRDNHINNNRNSKNKSESGYDSQQINRNVQINSNKEGDDDIIDGYIQDLRSSAVSQSKKVLAIENILSSYSHALESSSDSQTSILHRIEGIEQNIHTSNKFVNEASHERATLSIQVKTLLGKLSTLEATYHISEQSYATKESFSQLLDSTVDEIKSVGTACSYASVKSSQSVSLVEALIQAIHRLRHQADSFAVDDSSVSNSLSFEFLSSLSG